LQHDQPVEFFDKPDRLTISGVDRGAQRRIYDERRDAQIPEHGLLLWVITPGDVGNTKWARAGLLVLAEPLGQWLTWFD